MFRSFMHDFYGSSMVKWMFWSLGFETLEMESDEVVFMWYDIVRLGV